MAHAWDSFLATVKVVGVPTPYSAQACQGAAARLGIGSLPDSYREYVGRFGFGEWHDDLTVFVPCHPQLAGSIEDLTGDYKSLVAEVWSGDEHTKDPARMGRLIHFADTTVGFSFAWDPDEKREDGEPGIYMVAFPDVLEYCCHDLLVFLRDYWIGGKINDVYLFEGGERWVTGPVFTVKRPSPPLGKPKAG